MKQLRDGDQALRELYKRYSGLVYSLARAIVDNDADAEEVVLDTFMKVWREAGRFDPARGSVRSWITTIARSRALDRIRSRKRHRKALERSAATNQHGLSVPLSPAGDAEKDLERRLGRDRLTRWLGDLPPEQKEALELAYLGGLSHTEIAQQLDTPLGTVKTRIRTALLSLRAKAAQPAVEGGS